MKKVPKQKLTVLHTVRFSAAQFEEFERRGGARWLREELSKAPVKKGGSK